MVTNRHALTRMVVALGAIAATLSACGAMDDGGATITAEEVAQQEAQQKSDRDARQEKPQKAAQKERKDEAPARSTATNADLDAYVASAEKTMRQLFGGAAFEKLYSKIDIVPVYPSGIEYDYTFRRAVDPTLAAPELDRQGSTLRAQSRAVVIPEMEKFGFVDATVTFTYRNPDGSVVWTRTFS